MLDGEVVASHSAGVLSFLTRDGRLLDEPLPAGPDAWYDLASLTKVVSTITLLTLAAQGTLDLDAPVAEHLPGFRDGARLRVTLRMLLTHTAGLPPVWLGWQDQPEANRNDLLTALTRTPLQHEPGTTWLYSCVGFNVAMALAEQATGQPWQHLVEQLVLEPAGLADAIAFRPAGPVVATEWDATEGRLVQGIVHDETARALGGACANAGLFGTLAGVLQLAELLRTDSLPCPTAPMFQDVLPRLVGRSPSTPDEPPGRGHSLGLRMGEAWMHSPTAFGHTGFTGTSLLVDRAKGMSVVTLANRIHPSRTGGDPHRLRGAIAHIAQGL